MAMMPKLEAAIAATSKDPNTGALGAILREIGRVSPQAAELIEQDLENPELSLEKCFKALFNHAKAHQKQGAWGCGGFTLSPDNEAIKVILDFYHIPPEWIGGEAAPKASASAKVVDLFDFL